MARSLAACFAVFLAIVEIGSALQCYQCNTQNDPNCADPFNGKSKQIMCGSEDMVTYNRNFLYAILPAEVFSGVPGAPKACHKITMQTGTVVRTCLDSNPTNLQQICDSMISSSMASAPERKIKSCQVCDKDLCNSAGSVTFSLPLASLALIATYLACKQ